MYRGEYQLVGSEMSFFTRKLEAQLRFQGIPWRYLFKTEERKAELEQLAAIGSMMHEGFGKNVCEYNGVGPDQAGVVQADFRKMLDALALHFTDNGFLLGPRPCLADFALAGASKAHFICDPTPIGWLGEHRDRFTDYTEQFFGDWQENPAAWLTDDDIPESLTAVLDYLQATYFRFAPANVSAGLSGEKYYEYDYGYGPVRARTQNRLNVARLHVQDELLRSGADSHTGIQAAFAGRGILEYYLA